MQYLLVIFGWGALITSAALIVLPYLRGRGELLNSWTIFHFGACNFLGFASIDSGNAVTHMYNAPMQEDYVKYFLGGVVFYLVLLITYYFLPVGKVVANHVWVKVGRRTPSALLGLIVICFPLAMGYLFVPQIQFVGQWMVTIGRSACVFAVVFAFASWAQGQYTSRITAVVNRRFGLFLATLSMATVAANTELGRRDFLSVLITVPLCWYWYRGRYWRPVRVLVVASIFGFIAFLGVAGVSLTRFTNHQPGESIIDTAINKVAAIPKALQTYGTGSERIFGSDCADASLAAIRIYDHVKQPEPFFVLKYIMAHPVPRAWWPDKPKGLGYSLPYDVGWIGAHGDVSIGPGMIGHGYHEGGLFFIGFYAFLFAAFMRFFDTMLKRDPGNPYLLGILGAASGHLIGLLRGDVGLFSALMLGSFAAGILMNWIARILFGTDCVQTGAPAFPVIMDENQYGMDYPNGMAA